jgi:hypothetical protein
MAVVAAASFGAPSSHLPAATPAGGSVVDRLLRLRLQLHCGQSGA